MDPDVGLSARQSHRKGKLQAFRTTSTTRFTRAGCFALTAVWRASISAGVSSVTFVEPNRGNTIFRHILRSSLAVTRIPKPATSASKKVSKSTRKLTLTCLEGHNLKGLGSNPFPATNWNKVLSESLVTGFVFDHAFIVVTRFPDMRLPTLAAFISFKYFYFHDIPLSRKNT